MKASVIIHFPSKDPFLRLKQRQKQTTTTETM